MLTPVTLSGTYLATAGRRLMGRTQTLRFANALAAIFISRPREAGYPTLGQAEEYLGS